MYRKAVIWDNQKCSKPTKIKNEFNRRAVNNLPESVTTEQQGDVDPKDYRMGGPYFNFSHLSLLEEKTPSHAIENRTIAAMQPERKLIEVAQCWASDREEDSEEEKSDSEEEKPKHRKRKINSDDEAFLDSEDENKMKMKNKEKQKANAKIARRKDSQESTEDEDYEEESESKKGYVTPEKWWEGRDNTKKDEAFPYKQTDKYGLKSVGAGLPAVWFNTKEVIETMDIEANRKFKTNVKRYGLSYTWHHTVEEAGIGVIGQLVLTSLHEDSRPHIGGVGMNKD
jgi:hypothetical protein